MNTRHTSSHHTALRGGLMCVAGLLRSGIGQAKPAVVPAIAGI